jgi:membrane protein implicated in regulation of membrane protease activity
MARNRGVPRFVLVLLALAAVVVLGPPALAVLLGLVGLAAVALKVGVIVLAVYAVVALFRALFGGQRSSSRHRPSDAVQRLDESRRALDEELARAVAAARE